jgi:hypothetical protein
VLCTYTADRHHGRYINRPKNVKNGSPYQFFRPNRIKYQIDRPIYIYICILYII